ncbi:MAG: family 43 glycosylhydrolase [Kiritimatiellae bacterium]|nr:family 43 glycosylhydrolase [Kiritimatiellia bacterium]
MRWFRGVLTLFGVAAAAISASGFENPVWPRNWPDPTVWRADDGYYYSFATPGPGRHGLIRSRDFFKWESSGKDPFTPDTWRKLHDGWRNIWAPDVAKIGGKWLMYVTVYNSAEDCAVAVLSSFKPAGPFEYRGIVTKSRDTKIRDTIDPEAVVDPGTGKVWLFFGSVGKIHRVELARDGLALAPGAKYVHVAGLTDRENPSREKVFEGSYLYRHNGYWYLFASAGRFSDESYRIVVGRSRTLDGEFIDKHGNPMTRGFAEPLLWSERGDAFYGPGHNGEIFTLNNGRSYLVYHCHWREKDRPGSRPRVMMVQEIRWDKSGWPYIEGNHPAAVVK